ncbi:MAG: ABC transporter permease [Anaerolineae bacterium]
MTGYIARRVLLTVPLLLALSVFVFALIKVAPGDATAYFIPSSFSDSALDLETFRTKLRQELGLDQPVYIQYLKWLSNVARGDFGYAFTYHVPVRDLIVARIPATLELQVTALLLAVMISIPVGIVAATRQYSPADHTVTTLSFLGLSLPNFWLALLLIMLFSVHLGWLPSGGIGDDKPLIERWRFLLLPAVVLALEYMAWYVRFMRSSLLDVMRSDYLTTARAKGLKERRVIYGHALKNGLLPMVTVIGLSLPRLLGGAIIVESVFAWPGLGRLAYDAVLRRDQPVIMALTMLTAAVIILSSLLVDILYVRLDPRISYRAKA